MWHGPGRRIDGLNFQEGVVVIWADQVAFLPTRPEKHLGAELAWSSAGFISLRGKEASYDLAGLWSQGPEHFEAEVAKVARDRSRRPTARSWGPARRVCSGEGTSSCSPSS
ncbi:MAG: hypothetical protein GY913_07835 [Proteobacteria bacterium]|nr:hypothetical protein [Pseudomonadota bacterium]MCP4916822.1 hypothetical protein [Pseudomonadota bacterium]